MYIIDFVDCKELKLYNLTDNLAVNRLGLEHSS